MLTKLKKLNYYILFAAALISFLWTQNNILVVTNFEYKSKKVPREFDNFRILQVSDLHNKQFGKEQRKLIEKTKKLKPDVIVITGDLIDKNRTNQQNLNMCLEYLQEAVNLAPVYFVTGNHEGSSYVYKDLKERLKDFGVRVLDNKTEKIYKSKSWINIVGINDILFFGELNSIEAFESSLCDLIDDDQKLNILLSHRPAFLKSYEDAHADLVLTGHNHGGQIVIPFIGGIINVNDDEKTKRMISGCYEGNGTTMVISRGLGNSLFPLRFLNYPELVVITLKSVD